MSDKDNIFPIGGEQRRAGLPEDKLLAYLEGKLPPSKQHEVEQWLAEDGMESDAVEGLLQLRPSDTKQSIEKINHQLRIAISNKKRARKPLKTEQYTLIAVVIILLLTVLVYIVIRKAI